jgi:hypothetical protein
VSNLWTGKKTVMVASIVAEEKLTRNAVWDPSASLMNRFIAVKITDILNLSESIKSKALPMAMKILRAKAAFDEIL